VNLELEFPGPVHLKFPGQMNLMLIYSLDYQKARKISRSSLETRNIPVLSKLP
jgi:hypothetical protein